MKFSAFLNENMVFVLSFITPCLLLEITYVTCTIYPVGNRSLLIIDLFHQYAPFLSDLQDRFSSFSSMLYSWAGGLGTSYLPLYAYYLASPLNIISVIFPKQHLPELVLVLTLLKIGMAGAFFAYYLKSIHKEQGLMTVAFALLYSLSSYVLVFSWNIMWMDAIYLLPLIMLGLVRLIRDNRGLLFCITLAIALFSNFYMAIFICIFIALYFPVCLFSNQNIKKPSILIKRTLKFTGYSIMAAGLSAVLLLPTYFALKLSSAADDIFPNKLTNYFDLFDYITRHFTATLPSVREGMPNLYSGIIVLILIPVYFMSRSVRLKEKLWNIALLLILIVSFNTNILNFIWHGFHFPNQIPYRFSFVYIFLVLSLSYRGFKSLNEFTGKQLGAICIAVLGLVVLSQKFDDLSMDYVTLYVSIAFIIIYAAALTADRHMTIKPSFKLLFLVIVITVEVLTNTLITTHKIDFLEGYSNRDGYSDGKVVMQLREQIEAIKAKDKSFYRMEILPPKTTNDPYLYNYRGLSLFSSTSPLLPVRMMKNLGYHSNSINSYKYEGSTPILDSLFGIKYLIFRSVDLKESIYEQIAAVDKIKVFENKFVIPLGFMAKKELENYRSFSSNPFDAQNELVENICGVDKIMVPIEQIQGTNSNLTFSSSGTKFFSFKRSNKDIDSIARVKFKVTKDQQVYLYYRAPSNTKGTGSITVEGKKIDFNPKHTSLVNIGFCKSGASLELQINFEKTSAESGSFELYSSGIDRQAFENAMTLIQKSSLTIDSYTDTRVLGHVDAKDSGFMAMSIPYDKGWHVKVDDKEIKTSAIDNCLLGFSLPEGRHRIELWFVPDKYIIGLMITLAFMMVLLAIVIRAQLPLLLSFSTPSFSRNLRLHMDREQLDHIFGDTYTCAEAELNEENKEKDLGSC